MLLEYNYFLVGKENIYLVEHLDFNLENVLPQIIKTFKLVEIDNTFNISTWFRIIFTVKNFHFYYISFLFIFTYGVS